MKRLIRNSVAVFAFIFACNILCFFSAEAQLSIGIEGGYNKNYLNTNNANRAFTDYIPLQGFDMGIPIQYKIADWFAIGTDISFVQKNYSQQRSAFFAGVYQDNTNSYVQLPVMGHFMFGGQRLKGFLNAGIYAGYWMYARVKGEMPNILNISNDSTSTSSVYDYENPYSYNEKYTFNNTKDNRWEVGWIGGLGLSYDLNDHYQVFAEGRLLYSFTDQQKNYMINQVPRYNTTYGINAGLMYTFKSAHNKN
jgi:Outer membrane protein beta-barrel domain